MLKKIIILSITTTLLTACVTGPEGYLKRSANNKIFDTKGFHGSKRAPLYNKKYISQAKRNIINSGYDIDEDRDFDDYVEMENVSHNNIEMYKAMIEQEMSEGNTRRSILSRKQKPHYPSVSDPRYNMEFDNTDKNLELREELEQIKSILNDTKRELANNRCPSSGEIEENYSQKKAVQNTSDKHTINKKNIKDTAPDHVKAL